MLLRLSNVYDMEFYRYLLIEYTDSKPRYYTSETNRTVHETNGYAQEAYHTVQETNRNVHEFL